MSIAFLEAPPDTPFPSPWLKELARRLHAEITDEADALYAAILRPPDFISLWQAHCIDVDFIFPRATPESDSLAHFQSFDVRPSIFFVLLPDWVFFRSITVTLPPSYWLPRLILSMFWVRLHWAFVLRSFSLSSAVFFDLIIEWFPWLLCSIFAPTSFSLPA